MKTQFRSMLLLAATAFAPAGLAAAQVAPAPAPASQAPAVLRPLRRPRHTRPAPAPVVLPPLIWQSRRHSCWPTLGYPQRRARPRDYDPDGLIKPMQMAIRWLISAAATDRFNRLSPILALGHVAVTPRIGGTWSTRTS